MEKLKVMAICKDVPNVFRNKFLVTSAKYNNISMAAYFRAKSDFVFIGNDVSEDHYMDFIKSVREAIKDKPFITAEPTDRTMATLSLDGHLYCIEPAMESLIFNERIITDFKQTAISGVLGNIHMFRLASKPGIVNINGWVYTKDVYTKALNEKRIQILLSSNMLLAEFGSSKDKSYDILRAQILDPKESIGNIVAIGDNYIFIKENTNYLNMISEDDSNYLAYMRYIARLHDNKTVSDMSITTWDIWLKSDLPKSYLASLEDTLEYKDYIGSIEYSESDDRYYGKLFNINGLVDYSSDTIEGLRNEFKSAVDDYMDLIKEIEFDR